MAYSVRILTILPLMLDVPFQERCGEIWVHAVRKQRTQALVCVHSIAPPSKRFMCVYPAEVIERSLDIPQRGERGRSGQFNTAVKIRFPILIRKRYPREHF